MANPTVFPLESIISIIGSVVPVLSALASFFNHVVRQQQAAGQTPNKAVLAAGAVLNVGALNVDKTIQMVKMVRAVGGAKGEPKAE